MVQLSKTIELRTVHYDPVVEKELVSKWEPFRISGVTEKVYKSVSAILEDAPPGTVVTIQYPQRHRVEYRETHHV